MEKSEITDKDGELATVPLTSLKITDILLLNESGLPIIFRTYDEDSILDKKNEHLISGFLSAILAFAEQTQTSVDDIGIGSKRYYLERRGELICNVILKADSYQDYPFKRAYQIAKDIIARTFEAHFLLQNLGSFSSVNNESSDTSSNLKAIEKEIAESLGPILDNIAMETMIQLKEEGETLVKQALARMKEGTTYLDPGFEGKTQEAQLLRFKSFRRESLDQEED
ncbi:MAG: hypothetical protein ACFFBD_28800 [Candidatus Hodarchaeota archaeon]